MDPALFPALLAFSFVSSITPGPNNLMLLASGANFGFRRTLPHMFGVAAGHSFMVLAVGLFLMGLFHALPVLHDALTVVSVVYLLWLAWRIAIAVPKDGTARGRPLTFWEAAAFQWVNPKAWYMAIFAITLYAGDSTLGVIAVAGVFALTNLPSISAWAALGTELRRWLDTPSRLRAFNWTMAALLVLSLWPVVAPYLRASPP
ncbi:Putative threonine efflux protein [Rubellimicrobium thermophilum DSM 16684]|uniref:Putative threonine efflux protein n=1 Tax=Rubellimicrobium thermophilum DSM 16684 TaxID=1123069 RepID=S9R3U1_9RHOB|nr:LysE family translocator [Rubellimicrobium thermophilum]EPX86572.1 Putative threonine efflux protein [Rubellimicrobium thermophilum DSM 16684]